jgi:hypothetical protein
MKLELAEKIYDIACDYVDICPEDVEIRTDYIGRGHTEPTVGIVGVSPLKLAQIAIENANEFVNDDGEPLFDFARFEVDHMGLSYIIY